jgi:SAM-dependent methyltransferase
MSSHERWLDALWPTVREYLPPPPATIVELGCGRFGGFVPRLREDGYEAIGIDPAAPEGEDYQRVEFEHSDLPRQLDGVIACTSLHHVADPGEVVARIADALRRPGVLVVVEWDWQSFDEASARWCFDRAQPESWLTRRHEGWKASGQPWETYLRDWARGHGIHDAARLLRHLDERFQRVKCERGPYFFAGLTDTTESDEREAIKSGVIQALRIDYVGRPA